MYSRRQFLTSTAIATAAAAFAGRHADVLASAAGQPSVLDSSSGRMQTRLIPHTGEELPVIGMGTSGSFNVGESAAQRQPLLDVLQRFLAGGGRLIDTAPIYGSAEGVLGDLLAEDNRRSRVFLATKIWQAGREAGLAEFKGSLKHLRTDKVDLLQVHNLRDLRNLLPLVREMKKQGLTRYIGITHYVEDAQDELADIVQAEKPDFLQINYSVVSRDAEKRVLPLARDLGVAVLINRAFEDGKLFARVNNKPLPGWAAEAGITSWAQAFLKFALSNPAVTVVIPATAKVKHQEDNLKAGFGPDLDEKQRQSLIAMLD